MTTRKPEYLGDGIYLTDDGFQLWLGFAEANGVTEVIALEPEVFTLLMERGAARFKQMREVATNEG